MAQILHRIFKENLACFQALIKDTNAACALLLEYKKQDQRKADMGEWVESGRIKPPREAPSRVFWLRG